MQFKPIISFPEAYAPRNAWLDDSELCRLLGAARGLLHDPTTNRWATVRVFDKGHIDGEGLYVGARDWLYDEEAKTWRLVQLDGPAEVTRFLVDHERKRRWRGVCRMIVIAYKTGTRHMAILGMRWKSNGIDGWIVVPDFLPQSGATRRRGFFVRHGPRAKVTGKTVAAGNKTPKPWKLQALARAWQTADKRDGATHIVHKANGHPYRCHIAFDEIFARAGLQEIPTGDLDRRFDTDDASDKTIDMVFHLLRHTCAQRLYERGVNLWAAAAFIGCSPINLQRTYIGWTLLGMMDATGAIDRNFDPRHAFLRGCD